MYFCAVMVHTPHRRLQTPKPANGCSTAQKVTKMNDKYLFQLTVGEFLELVGQQRPEEIGTPPPERRYVFGLDGLCKLLGCCHTTAQSLKNSGALKGCYSQVGRKLVFDAEAVLEALKK